METKKFKIGGTTKTKGGFNNTRTTLTSAGIVAAGAAGFGAGSLLNSEDKPSEEALQDTATSEEVAQNVQTPQPTADQPEPAPTEVNDNITEPVPTDSNHPSPSNPTVTDQENVMPNDVAEEIIRRDEIDQNDVDAESVFDVAEFGTVTGPDGEEILVALIKAQDGTEFILADVDGDGIFNQVFDLAGNYVGEAEGNLTAGDLVAMADNSGGYLAILDDHEYGDDPSSDIINTEPGGATLAQNETPSDPTEEELLAELTQDLSGDEQELMQRILDDQETPEDPYEPEEPEDIDIEYTGEETEFEVDE